MSKVLYLNILACLFAICWFSEASFQFQDSDRARLSPEDYSFLMRSPLSRERRSSLPNFKYLFVSNNASVSSTRRPGHTQIEVAGSPGTSKRAIEVAAGMVARMVTNMPDDVFKRVAYSTSVGVFTSKEKLTIYPEFARFKNGDCGGNCNGRCKITCTSDGRKWESLAGAGGSRAAVLDDNVLCTRRDPYHHTESILVHEYSHSIHHYGLSYTARKKLSAAYSNAKKKKTWNLKSYSMATIYEYFAEASTVFFGVNIYKKVSSGDMNQCGKKLCGTESSGRTNLKKYDPALYNILKQVYTSNFPGLASGLSICPTHFG